MANKGKPSSDNDVVNPRITFRAPGKTFDRLLKEYSLFDLKETVRKKLGLGSGSVVQFAQLRNGQLVDLEDEDDFDAFCAIANEQRHATIQVALTENSVTEGSSIDVKGSTSPLPATPASALPGYGRLPANSSAFIPGGAVLHQKFVLINEVNLETLMTMVSPTPPTPSVTARQNLRTTPTRKTAPIRIETPEQRQRQKRLEEEKQKEKEAKAKTSAEEKEAKAQMPRVDDAAETEEQAKEKKQKKKERLQREKEEKRRREQEEQNRQNLPATNSSTLTEALSPSTRPSPLPSINQTSQHPPPSTQSSYTPYVSNALPQRHFFSQNSMSRSASTASKSSQLPSKSAWSKGPPQTASAPSPRSQSPAPSAQPQTSHSRRPSALGQGVSVKDSVSVPRNNVGAVKQGTAVTFGSIDDVSAPLSTPPATAPPVKSEGVKPPFGTVPNTHINGKASVASRPVAGQSTPTPSTSISSASASTSSMPATPVSATPPPKSKFDVHKLFQNPSSQPSNSSTSTETISPATRPSPFPSQTSVNQPSQHPPPSNQSSYTPFVPNARPQQPHQQQNTGPGSGPPPRSAYPRKRECE